jgi:hypothetical protein
MILDGRTQFGMGLDEFYRQEEIVLLVWRRGGVVPPLTEVDPEAPPALAQVNPLPNGMVRWIAVCPACQGRGRASAEYVWLTTPLMFCTRCCNADLGGKWRQVQLPEERAEIERLLLLRPDPETRGWRPDESVLDLQDQNEIMGLGGGVDRCR